MKKILLILSLLIVCSAIVSAESLEHYFAVDDSSPTRDVVILTKVIKDLEGDIGNNYVTKLNSEIGKDNLDNRVTLFIYKENALIIVGENSPSEQVILATKILNLLKSDYGIEATTKISNEIVNDDLTKEIVIKTPLKRNWFVLVEPPASRDVSLLNEIINNFNSEIGDNYEIIHGSEVSKEDMNYRVTTFVYNGRALIIVGENSLTEQVTQAKRISDYLKEKKDIVATIKVSSDITSNDLKNEISIDTVKDYCFMTDENAPTSDVILLTELVNRLGNRLNNNYEIKLNGEIKNFNYKLSVFIYQNNALIIVGDNSPTEQVVLATDISKILKEEYEIIATIKISSELSGTDLSKEIQLLKCRDTDSKDIYTKGKVTYTDETGKISTFEDTCDNSRLKEYICQDSSSYSSFDSECTYGCSEGHCLSFLSGDTVENNDENIDSSTTCSAKSCNTVSEACAGDDKVLKEECKIYIKNNDACEEQQILHTKVMKNACIEEVKKHLPTCQGCQIDDTTCIPFGIRLENNKISFYCDITQKMTEQKADKQNCQNSYECLSNNCKSGSCKPICEGCLNEESDCIPISTRTDTKYCDIDYNFKEHKTEEMACNNNYECSTNLCVNNKCISPSFIQKIIDWFSKLFGG